MRVTALWKHDCVVVFSHVCSFSSGGTHTHINTHAHTHTAWWLDSAELLFILLADNSLIRTKTANVFSSYFISSVCCKWMLERLMHHSIDYVRYKCHLSPGGGLPPRWSDSCSVGCVGQWSANLPTLTSRQYWGWNPTEKDRFNAAATTFLSSTVQRWYSLTLS